MFFFSKCSVSSCQGAVFFCCQGGCFFFDEAVFFQNGFFKGFVVLQGFFQEMTS